MNSVTIIFYRKWNGGKLLNMASNEGFFTFPDENEIKAAQLACCGRHCTACEAPAEYAWRKRSVDLAILLEGAIENELTLLEREEIKDFWFNDKSLTQIAADRGISPSSVSAGLERAEEKLKKVLGYAVRYQHDVSSESIIPLALGRARVIAAARSAVGGTPALRIMRLRQSQNLSREALSKATDISSQRLKRIENAKASPDSEELVALSEFFAVSTDYILKGADSVGK